MVQIVLFFFIISNSFASLAIEDFIKRNHLVKTGDSYIVTGHTTEFLRTGLKDKKIETKGSYKYKNYDVVFFQLKSLDCHACPAHLGAEVIIDKKSEWILPSPVASSWGDFTSDITIFQQGKELHFAYVSAYSNQGFTERSIHIYKFEFEARVFKLIKSLNSEQLESIYGLNDNCEDDDLNLQFEEKLNRLSIVAKMVGCDANKRSPITKKIQLKF